MRGRKGMKKKPMAKKPLTKKQKTLPKFLQKKKQTRINDVSSVPVDLVVEITHQKLESDDYLSERTSLSSEKVSSIVTFLFVSHLLFISREVLSTDTWNSYGLSSVDCGC